MIMSIPLQLPRIGAPFPIVQALPRINSIVDELQSTVQAPRPLIFSSVLSAISLVLQGLVDVQKPKGGVSPCSLMLLCIAESGERKSSVDRIVLGPVKDAQARMDRAYKYEYSQWKINREMWEMKRRAIQRKIERLAGRGETSLELEGQYTDWIAVEPKRPRQFKMLYEDTTSEALFYGLHQDTSTAGIITSEGGGVLRGAALSDLSKQNSLWSGDSIHVDRMSRESFTIEGARLTVSMMVQGEVFKKFMLSHGDQTRGSGLWARFLVCRPESTQGRRLINIDDSSINWNNSFTSRLAELLSENLSKVRRGSGNRQVLIFDEAAKARWVETFNFIEARMVEGEFWEGMKDHASKLADNIARVAALFHCFEVGGGSEKVSERALDAAIRVCFWYSGEFAKIFSKAGQVEDDARELLDWMERKEAENGCLFRKNYILKFGPNRLRRKSTLEEALHYLHDRWLVEFEYTVKGCYVKLCSHAGHRYHRAYRGGGRAF